MTQNFCFEDKERNRNVAERDMGWNNDRIEMCEWAESRTQSQDDLQKIKWNHAIFWKVKYMP